MEDRNQVVNDCEEMSILLDNTEDLVREKEDLLKRVSDIVTLVENLIKKNATVPMPQYEFQSTYDEYDKEHSKIINKIGKLENEIRKRKAQAKQLKVFINDLSNIPDVLEEWDENVWNYLIEKATVKKDDSITFLFRNGKEIKVK